MSTFTESGERTFNTVDEAYRFARDLKGKVRYSLMVTAFLPTTEDKGFEGMTFIRVTRRQFLEAMKNTCSKTLEERGAKVRLHLTAPDEDSVCPLYHVSMY